MRRIAGRSWVTWFLIAVLLGGLGFFIYEWFTQGDSWVLSSGSPHIYDDHGMACGTVVDREGILLLDQSDGGVYSENELLRRAVLHWVGDREGNIHAPVVSYYAEELAGYDLVNGVYSYGGVGGQAKLTLSAKIQMAALEAMGDHVGTIAVYNYRTGELLCAVTTPTFDPDDLPDIAGDTTGIYEGVYLNRFLQSVYIPGSIFKIATTAAVLESSDQILDMTFVCTGKYEFGVDRVTCERVHGEVDLKTAMQESCNCAFAQIALHIGAEELDRYVHQFRLTDRLSFDGITTAGGNFKVIGEAKVNLAWSAIGQHLDQINPCRFMTFVGAVANDGVMVEPYVVENVSSDGVSYQAQTKETGRIMSEETAKLLQEYMRNNVVNNYGADNFPGLTVCAKTGTGEVDGDKKSNAMFAGFVADEEYPLAFIVAVENGGYGKKVCIPIIQKVLETCKEVLNSQS